MPDDESMRTELDEGEVIWIPWSSLDHADVAAELVMRLWAFAKPRKLGRVYPGNTGFRLTHNTVRAPSVSSVRQARAESVRSKGFALGAPDLAVETFSPSSDVRQLLRKVKQYLAAGTRTVWLIHLERGEVDVFEASGTDRTLSADNMLDAPELLPGFSVKIAELFS